MNLKYILTLIILIFAYFVAGKLGLSLAFVNQSATAVWPPTGIALAALLIFGYRVWPAIFIGAFLANFSTTGTILTSLGIALGNTLEGVIGVYLVNKFAGGQKAFYTVSNIFKFIFFAAILATTISANIGVLSLILGGFAQWTEFNKIWLTWWMGDATGALIITPFLIFWRARHPLQVREKAPEAFFVFLSLLFVGVLVFGGLLEGMGNPYPIEFLSIPIITWVAFRFGRRETITAIILLSGIAIFGTVNGFGPFVRDLQNESLLLLQAFMSVVTITAMVLSVAVSERRKAEERLRHTLDSMTEGFQIIGFDWKYKYVNNAISKQGKRKPEELLNHTMMEMYPGIEKTELFTHLKRCMEKRIPHKMESEFNFPDGSKGWFALRIEPVEEGLIILSVDITHEKEVDEMKTEFISLASHELRTPLSAIRGFVSMINDGDYGKINENLKRPLYIIDASTQRLIHIVNEMLDVSRIEAGRLQFAITMLTVDNLIKDVVSNLKSLVEEKKIKLIVEKSQNFEIRADKEKVIEILNNLIGNSLKFTEKGSISIGVQKKKDQVIIFVSDTGIGIQKEDRQKLFNKFEQLKSKKIGKNSGTGLGLYISREFARKMGGDLWIEDSELGKGSKFALSLPGKIVLVKK